MLAMMLVVTAIAGHDVAGDPLFTNYFADLVMHSGLSNRYSESAAFLARDANGDVQCLAWPATNEVLRETFRGAIPPGTLAIVHTHPMPMRMPSDHDMDLALTLHLPMIVLTRTDISLFDPDAKTTSLLIRDHNWLPRHPVAVCTTAWLKDSLNR